MRSHSAAAWLGACALVAAASAAGCRSPRRVGERDAGAGPAASPSPPAATGLLEELSRIPAPPPDMRCDDMNAQQCRLSAHCVLDPPARVDGRYAGGLYVCREAVPPCEGGMGEADPGFPDDCASRPGCAFREAECVCFPQTRVALRTRSPAPDCGCGGGPPRRCVAAGR